MKVIIPIFTVIREDLDGDFNPVDIFVSNHPLESDAEAQIEELTRLSKGVLTYSIKPNEVEIEVNLP